MRKSLWLLIGLVSALLILNGCKKGGDGEKTPDDKTTPAAVDVKKGTDKAAVPVAIPSASSAAPASTSVPAPGSVSLGDISGHYVASRGVLDVVQVSPQLSRFSLRMEGQGSCSAMIGGTLFLTDNTHGRYEEKTCMLKFAFDQGLIQVTEEGEDCSAYHDNSCSFSDIYKASATPAAAVPAATTAVASDGTMPGGHYSHKFTSADGAQCRGWEVWLTPQNDTLDVKAAIYDGTCVASPLVGQNVRYDANESTLSFDVSSPSGNRSFSGQFDDSTDLQGSFNP